MNLKLNKFIMSKKEITALKNDLTQKFVIDPLMQKGNLTKESLQPFQLNFDFIQLIQKFKDDYMSEYLIKDKEGIFSTNQEVIKKQSGIIKDIIQLL